MGRKQSLKFLLETSIASIEKKLKMEENAVKGEQDNR